MDTTTLRKEMTEIFYEDMHSFNSFTMVGDTAIWRISETLSAKAEFIMRTADGYYDAIKLSIIKIGDSVVDTCIIGFETLFSCDELESLIDEDLKYHIPMLVTNGCSKDNAYVKVAYKFGVHWLNLDASRCESMRIRARKTIRSYTEHWK